MAGIGNDYCTAVQFKSYWGQLAIMRSFVADGNYLIKTTTYKRQILGLGAYSNKEGDYFSKNRYWVRYAIHQKIGNGWSVSAGASGHAISYGFKPSSAGASGTDTKLSGQVAIGAYSSKTKVGLSANDINNPKLQPIDNLFSLPRFYTVYLYRLWDLDVTWAIATSARSNFSTVSKSSFGLNVSLVYKEKMFFNTNFINTQGFGLAFGFTKLQIDTNNFLDLAFAYKISNYGIGISRFNSYEIALKYNFNKGQNEETSPE